MSWQSRTDSVAFNRTIWTISINREADQEYLPKYGEHYKKKAYRESQNVVYI